MAIYYDASEKGAEKRGKEWRAAGEKLMAGNREFARWKLINYLTFGSLACLAGVLLFAFVRGYVVSGNLPPNDEWAGRWMGLGLAAWIWSIGRGRYTTRCRKIALAAEMEKQATERRAKQV